MTPGASLGRYLVIEELGKGGMGVVYRAYDPKLQREVALKVVRTDSLDDDAEARIVREARAMASLSHPNVVAVHDVEIESTEGVVLVMEFVQGQTLAAWLRERERSWREVVAAFVEAGRGLDAAHARGLLHRDFKPENVLIGRDDRVRVTDFGLARREAVDDGDVVVDPSPGSIDRESLDDGLTMPGLIIGTPAYMAPEQNEPGRLTVAVDQYAFCVALWHALGGSKPFRGENPAALLRAKLAGPPAWSGPTIPRRLVEALRRGLASDPKARWPSLAALLHELDRLLRPRLSRATTAIGALVGVAIVGWWVTARNPDPAPKPCTGADEEIAEIWSAATEGSIGRAFAATSLPYATPTWTELAPQLDAWADAWAQQHRDACEATAVRKVQSGPALDLRMACLRDARVGLRGVVETLRLADPDVVERADAVVGSLPRLARCEDLDGLRASVVPPDPALAGAVVAVHDALAEIRPLIAVGRFAQAAERLAVLDGDAASAAYPPLHTELGLVRSGVEVGLAHYPEAHDLLDEVMTAALQQGQWALAVDAVTRQVWVVGEHLNRPDEAKAYAATAWGLFDRHPEPELAEASLRNNLGNVARTSGALDDARAQHEAALELRSKVLGPTHPDVAMSHNNLGNVMYQLARFGDAESHFRRTIEITAARHGDEHPQVALSRSNLGLALLAQGKIDESVAEQRRALEARRRLYGEEHPVVAAAMDNLGLALRTQGRADEAIALHRAALSIEQRVHGADHPAVGRSHANLAHALFAAERVDDAIAEQHRAKEVLDAALGDAHSDVGTAYNNLAVMMDRAGQHAEAVAIHRAGLAIRRRALPPSHPDITTSLLGLTESLLHEGRGLQEAKETAEACLERLTEAGPGEQADAQRLLAETLWRLGGHRERAIELAEAARMGFAQDSEDRPEVAEMDALLERWRDPGSMASRR